MNQDSARDLWKEERESLPPIEEVPPAPEGLEIPTPSEPQTPAELPLAPGLDTVTGVIRRGLRETPQMRAGFGFTIALALTDTVGRLMVPILIQLIIRELSIFCYFFGDLRG